MNVYYLCGILIVCISVDGGGKSRELGGASGSNVSSTILDTTEADKEVMEKLVGTNTKDGFLLQNYGTNSANKKRYRLIWDGNNIFFPIELTFVLGGIVNFIALDGQTIETKAVIEDQKLLFKVIETNENLVDIYIGDKGDDDKKLKIETENLQKFYANIPHKEPTLNKIGENARGKPIYHLTFFGNEYYDPIIKNITIGNSYLIKAKDGKNVKTQVLFENNELIFRAVSTNKNVLVFSVDDANK